MKLSLQSQYLNKRLRIFTNQCLSLTYREAVLIPQPQLSLTYNEALQKKQPNAHYPNCCHNHGLQSRTDPAPRLQLSNHLRGDRIGLVKLQSE